MLDIFINHPYSLLITERTTNVSKDLGEEYPAPVWNIQHEIVSTRIYELSGTSDIIRITVRTLPTPIIRVGCLMF